MDESTGCWVWLRGTIASKQLRYGAYHRDGRTRVAHVESYEHHRGPIPPGLRTDHLCRNTLCVNPDHLEPVTQAVNVQRGRSAKMDEDKVRSIRRRLAAGETEAALSVEYDLSRGAMWWLANRRSWVGVEP